jgi:hypothetical protein
VVSFRENCDTGKIVLKDPSGLMKGSGSHEVVHRDGMTLSMPGTVLVLQNVSLFVPCVGTVYLNVTLNNVVAVIPPSQAVPNEMEPFSRHVNNVSAQTSSSNSSIRSASEENIFDLVGENARGLASMPSSSSPGRSVRLESNPRSILSSKTLFMEENSVGGERLN